MNVVNTFFLLLLALASFRLTRLIVFDRITSFLRKPFLDQVEELNEKGEVEEYIIIKGKGISAWFGELLSCYWCTGIWVSTLLYVLLIMFPIVGEPVLFILGVAGLAGILEAVLQRILR
ncbi:MULTISPECIES: DUF1360 domain-containing protein [Sutcliffiella]|uniref:Sporulation protein n=1 Tax=Sutcliffiella cohnii TaxID=33932 RepID=A0A223KMM6_9BACI|nr:MULTISPECIES: DUF1360 domain-containing protein [Sutcliffiella]AST90656.1 sporulation protein [Sutcliffiella cohnii]MED4016945.1 DUF1360 domain-containing protein [Sutcliffiella cohnii]WBL16309.1 DUF1360 domain-containing protein [Sutcliffiella sp. NC1]